MAEALDLVRPFPAFPRLAKPVWKGHGAQDLSLCGTSMKTTPSQGWLLHGSLVCCVWHISYVELLGFLGYVDT